jgi:general secretion pathway protein D
VTSALAPSLRRHRARSLAIAATLGLGAVVSLLAVPAGAQATVQAQPAAAVPQPATVHINFVNADLGDVIRSLAAALGVNMVLTDVPPRRITFQTPQPVAASQAGAILEGILASQGLILVQNGPVTQVLPDDKRPATGPLRVGKTFPDPAPLGLVTQIVPLDYMRADEAVSLLHDVADKLARIEVVPRSNAILVTDRGVNVARYLDLIRQVDVKTGGEAGLSTYVYPLKHANAAELASTLGQVFGATVAAPAPRARVQALEGKGLSSSLQGLQTRELESVQQRTQIPLETAPAPAQSDSAQSAGRLPAGALVGGTTIVPDQSTNSLVIRTAPPNFSVLQGTIDQLDVRPAQVLLEVLIAEVNLDKSTQFGINWNAFSQKGFGGSDSTRGVLAGVGPQIGDSSLSSLAGAVVRVVSIGTINVRGVLQALAAHTNVRVLSAPRVLALNNEKARILVGSQVPFTSASLTSLNAVVDQVVQYQNVGTQLTVLPTVNKDGYVTFRILQEVSELSTSTVAAAQNSPIITTREAETSAIVKTGHSVVIGGLIGETRSDMVSGIPLLQDIPLLGNLFKTKSTDHQRTELAIFLTPHVVTTDEEADSLLHSERDKLRLLGPQVDSVLDLTPPNPRK